MRKDELVTTAQLLLASAAQLQKARMNTELGSIKLKQAAQLLKQASYIIDEVGYWESPQ